LSGAAVSRFSPFQKSEVEMLETVVSKVMWVGRATVFLVGHPVILALVLVVATTAMGVNGNRFVLGYSTTVLWP
jgi:hypothetical protein